LDIAVRHGISGYDAQYAALAARLGCVLVTEDRRLRTRLGSAAMLLDDAIEAIGQA
jgi:predicted nucleic acid-binding protein